MSKISTMDAIRLAVARHDALFENPDAPVKPGSVDTEQTMLARGIVELHERLRHLEAQASEDLVGSTVTVLDPAPSACPIPTEAPSMGELEAAWEKLRRQQATAGDCYAICDLGIDTLRAIASGSPSYEPTRYSDAEVRLARALIIVSALALSREVV